jgi:competence protein ComFC
MKQDNRKDVIDFLADEMSDAIASCINADLSTYVITNVPRRKGAIVEFGYDHAERLAKVVSHKMNIEYVELLKSKSKKPQKSVYGHERIENAKFEYKCKKDYTLKGKNVILVDDIVTTGASMTNCATLIRGLKPKRIIGACLGTAYKEPYTDFSFSAFE